LGCKRHRKKSYLNYLTVLKLINPSILNQYFYLMFQLNALTVHDITV
jgi:hypothetical protein